MATQADVRLIAHRLAGTSESPDDFRFFVDGKQYLWLWQERVDPKKARVPNPDVLVARTGSDVDKQVLLAMDREIFFTEPHYDGYNAVLIRLKKIRVPMLRDVITQAWQSRAGGVSGAGRARPRSRRDPRRGPASRRAR